MHRIQKKILRGNTGTIEINRKLFPTYDIFSSKLEIQSTPLTNLTSVFSLESNGHSRSLIITNPLLLTYWKRRADIVLLQQSVNTAVLKKKTSSHTTNTKNCQSFHLTNCRRNLVNTQLQYHLDMEFLGKRIQCRGQKLVCNYYMHSILQLVAIFVCLIIDTDSNKMCADITT